MRLVLLFFLTVILAGAGCITPRHDDGPPPQLKEDGPTDRDWNSTMFKRGLLPKDRKLRKREHRTIFDEEDDD